MSSLAQYAVLRYLPNRERDEPRNVGIILASNATGNLLVRMTTQPQDTKLTREQRMALAGFASEFQEQLRKRMAERKPEEILSELVTELANSLVATQPRPISVEDPKKVIDALFDDFVKSKVPWLGKELLLSVVSALRERRS